jgi:transcriptional regulator with XRE-family HTH domain
MPRERRALANAIRELRSRRRLTQEELAGKAKIGHNYVSEIENGRKGILFETLLRIIRALDVTLAEFEDVFLRQLADESRQSASPRGARPAATRAP